MTDGQKLALILSKMTDTENVTGCIPDPPPYGLILVVTGLRCYNNVQKYPAHILSGYIRSGYKAFFIYPAEFFR